MKRLDMQLNEVQDEWLTKEIARIKEQGNERLKVSKRELMDRVLNAAMAGKAYKGIK